jgi:hypothetical protein
MAHTDHDDDSKVLISRSAGFHISCREHRRGLDEAIRKARLISSSYCLPRRASVLAHHHSRFDIRRRPTSRPALDPVLCRHCAASDSFLCSCFYSRCASACSLSCHLRTCCPRTRPQLIDLVFSSRSAQSSRLVLTCSDDCVAALFLISPPRQIPAGPRYCLPLLAVSSEQSPISRPLTSCSSPPHAPGAKSRTLQTHYSTQRRVPSSLVRMTRPLLWTSQTCSRRSSSRRRWWECWVWQRREACGGG